MPQTANYILPTQAPDFAGNFLKGMAITDAIETRKREEAARLAQAQQQAQMQADLGELSKNPTVATITSVMAKYPSMADKFKPILDSATAQQKQAKIGQASDVYASLLAGRTDIAQRLLADQAAASRNSGDEQAAKSAEAMSEILNNGDMGRNTVLSSAGMFLASAMGPEKFHETYSALTPKSQEAEKPMTAIGKLNWELAQGMITREQFDAAFKKETTHAPAVRVDVNTKQEAEESKTVGKGFGDTYIELQKNGLAARGKISRYTRMSQLLEGVSTGKFTPTKTQVAAIADGLGVTLDPKLGDKQALESLSNEIALQLRNPSGGAGMPGAMSDKDRDFLTGMTPGLTKTPEGNRLIIDTAQKLAQRDLDVARIARDYRKKNGSLDEGFYDELAAFSDANPLFPSAKQGGGSLPRTAPAKGAASVDDLLKALGH